MSDANTREKEFLIIRRSGSAELESPKGGVWKIAYADFMTAMMAFFLVMWLINATSETTKTGVANYFNPIKLSDGMQLPRKGLQNPEDAEPSEAEGSEKAEPADKPAPEPAKAAEPATSAKDDPARSAVSEGDRGDAGAGHAAETAGRFSEDALFRDPYAVLAAIAAEADGISSLAGSGGSGDSAGGPDGAAGQKYGDLFDPSAWGAAAGPATAARQVPSEVPPAETGVETPTIRAMRQQAAPPPEGAEGGAGREPSDGPVQAEAGDPGNAAGDAEAARLQTELLRTLKQAVASRSMPNVTVEHAEGGVLISLADQVDFGMFAIGSAEPLPETIAVMAKIAQLLKEMPGKVIIRGHTDARPFRSGAYDNWRLSSDRAHMAYYMLVRGGLDEHRVERIEGYADRDLKLPEKPDAAENRRIDILVQQEASRS